MSAFGGNADIVPSCSRAMKRGGLRRILRSCRSCCLAFKAVAARNAIASNIAKLPELGHGPKISPKTGPHSIAKITTRATGGHYGEAEAAACASQADRFRRTSSIWAMSSWECARLSSIWSNSFSRWTSAVSANASTCTMSTPPQRGLSCGQSTPLRINMTLPGACSPKMRRGGSRPTSPSCRSFCGSRNQISGIDSSARRARCCQLSCCVSSLCLRPQRCRQFRRRQRQTHQSSHLIR
jgi:hypothetical protein